MDIRKKATGNDFSRRNFLAGASAAYAAASLELRGASLYSATPQSQKIPVCIFSKHLQWLDYDGMAETAKEAGFDGIDLTVRPGGHVIPERAVDDLPKAVEAAKKAGITIPMMVADILDPDNPLTETILRTASKLGIKYYRLAYGMYDEKQGVIEQLENLKPKLRGLAELNKQYEIVGCFHNHSGPYIGAPLWDSWLLLKDIVSPWMGFQYDSWHALQIGVRGSWKISTRLVAPRTKTMVVKTQGDWSNPAWQASTEKQQGNWNHPTPDNLRWVFRLMRDQGYSGPITAHYEYPLGGVDAGRTQLKGITRQEVLTAFKSNLSYIREIMRETNLM